MKKILARLNKKYLSLLLLPLGLLVFGSVSYSQLPSHHELDEVVSEKSVEENGGEVAGVEVEEDTQPTTKPFEYSLPTPTDKPKNTNNQNSDAASNNSNSNTTVVVATPVPTNAPYPTSVQIPTIIPAPTTSHEEVQVEVDNTAELTHLQSEYESVTSHYRDLIALVESEKQRAIQDVTAEVTADHAARGLLHSGIYHSALANAIAEVSYPYDYQIMQLENERDTILREIERQIEILSSTLVPIFYCG